MTQAVANQSSVNQVVLSSVQHNGVDFSVDIIVCFVSYVNMWKFMQILALVLLCGCNIFSLREADEPDKPAEWNYFYTTFDKTVKNLEYIYEDKRNIVKYSELFVPEFSFYFSQQDINDYNIIMLWNRDKERDMLYNLHNHASKVEITLDKITGQNDDTLSVPVRIYRQYTVKVWNQNNQTEYKGKMELQMKQVNGFWRIFKWYDYRSATPTLYPTWGKLKYDLSV